MSKITLLIDDPIYLGLCAPWIEPLINDYVDIEQYQPDRQYNPRNTVCYVSYTNTALKGWAIKLLDSGFKVVIDHLWDGDVDTLTNINGTIMRLRNANWIWYTSALEWAYRGYDRYVPAPAYSHSFFMPMNRYEWHRDEIIKSLSSVLPGALYSYIAQNKHLIDDNPKNVPWRSYFNPAWYNSTKFSVVAESYMRSTDWIHGRLSNGLHYKTEVSEKIFKPIMGQHPFIVYGSVDSLKYLHREGFETFANLFDESYDLIVDDHQRHAAVTQTVIDAVNSNFDIDKITQEKIRHNHARLFDLSLVREKFKTEILDSILEFAQQ
jgi:hypothetical protein